MILVESHTSVAQPELTQSPSQESDGDSREEIVGDICHRQTPSHGLSGSTKHIQISAIAHRSCVGLNSVCE